MEDRGWFRVERRVFDDEWLNDEPATKLSAWLDLIALATHKPITLRLKHGKVALERGQLTASLGFLATRWAWPKARVQRFIAALERRAMVDTATDTGQLVLTIRNYCEYQDAETERDTAPIRDRYGTDTAPIQNTTTEPQNQSSPSEKNKGRGRDPAPSFETFWNSAKDVWRGMGSPPGNKGEAKGEWAKLSWRQKWTAHLCVDEYAKQIATERQTFPDRQAKHVVRYLRRRVFSEWEHLINFEETEDAAEETREHDRADRGAGRGGDAPQGAGEGGGGDGPVSVRPDGDPACRPDVAVPDLFRRGPDTPFSSPAAPCFEAGGADVGAECGRRGRALH